MIRIDRSILADVKAGRMSIEQLGNYLLRNFPASEIALALAETIQYEEPKPITITKEEFEQHFRIRGVKPDGTIESRGRKRVSDVQP